MGELLFQSDFSLWLTVHKGNIFINVKLYEKCLWFDEGNISCRLHLFGKVLIVARYCVTRLEDFFFIFVLRMKKKKQICCTRANTIRSVPSQLWSMALNSGVACSKSVAGNIDWTSEFLNVKYDETFDIGMVPDNGSQTLITRLRSRMERGPGKLAWMKDWKKLTSMFKGCLLGAETKPCTCTVSL